jgi:hypothetical protein
LKIEQAGEPDIEFHARYKTRPFDGPIYYAVRLGFKYRKMDWEIQFIHHKLYLTNPPPEVQHFEISHGFNLMTLNRVFPARTVSLRIGLGFVLPHTQSEVRNRKYTSIGGILGLGYRFAGPVFLAGLGKRFPLGRSLFFALDTQVVYARAGVPIANGKATASNCSAHGLFGLGYEF